MQPTLHLQTISKGYDRKHCWVHARPAVFPPATPLGPLRALISAQPLLLSGDDVFSEVHTFHSEDDGVHWSSAVSHSEALGRRPFGDGIEEGFADVTPGWHESTGVILATGLNSFYRGDKQLTYPDGRQTAYAVYHPAEKRWLPWKKLSYPGSETPLIEGAGCTQRVDLPDGDILLPTYLRSRPPLRDPAGNILHASTVMRCSFDGETLLYREHGTELTLPDGRGLVEPSLVFYKERFYLTLRNDKAAYVTVSKDGLRFPPPRRWTFDDGSDLGSYNTQQHWVTGGGGLYLVYTRRGAANDHIMRHRAPLFLAQVDPERLCILRETEQILVPERGARLCNFGVTRINDTESWVTVAEWMQTTLPNPFDYTRCEHYGADNRIYLARICFP